MNTHRERSHLVTDMAATWARLVNCPSRAAYRCCRASGSETDLRWQLCFGAITMSSDEDARRLQPRDLAAAAGLRPNADPRIVYANLFQGAGFPIAMNQGGWDCLPSGSKEDPELRGHFDAHAATAFKARAKILASFGSSSSSSSSSCSCPR